MTLAEFEQMVFDVAMSSPICGVPDVRRLTSTFITLRFEVTAGGFVDAFFNDQTGTMAFAWIRDGKRVFGADNTGGWHLHPLNAPDTHEPLLAAIPFGDFIGQIERHTAGAKAG